MTRPSGPCPAKIMIVGEAPGEQEEARGEPFVGYSGQELDRMLRDVGLMRGQTFCTNVIRKRPPGNDANVFFAQRKSDITLQHVFINGRHALPVVLEGVELLKREIEMCQPNVIIALGNVALWALTGSWGITSWRGSVMECSLPLALDYKPKVIPTYHPALILRQWSWRQVGLMDLRRAKREGESRIHSPPDYDFIISPDYHQAAAILQNLIKELDKGPLRISCDIETRAGHIACIGFAWNKTSAICIPLMKTDSPEGYWDAEEEAQLTYLFYRLLMHRNCRLLGQNFSYDAQYILRHWHFNPPVFRDTMLAHHACFSNMQKGLDFLSSMYCQKHLYWKDESKDWDPKVGERQLWTYNCKDAVITFEVDEEEEKTRNELAKSGWPELPAIHDFQQSLLAPVLKSMNRGLRSNQKLRGEFAMSLSTELAEREQYFIDVLGYPLNPKSPKQMQELFYASLGQKPIFNRKTGSITCDDEALGKLAEREPVLKPLIRKVLEFRSLGVFLSTFVNAALDNDGRIRCSFNIAGTETYRFSSSQNAFGSGLNLQNIPKGGEGSESDLELPNVRNLFIPDPGKTFFDIDLSSADLRIVVWESDEGEMKKMLAEGADPYTEIAKEFYHDPTIGKKDPRRQTFKAFAHGTHYLGTAKGLAERLGLSVHEMDKTQKWYFQRFPKIKQWQEDFKDQVAKRRYVQNIFGYRCYFFDRIEGNVFNQAIAWVPQSTVACLINRGYVNIDKNLPEVEVLLQVHDSLAGQFATHHGDWATRRITEECAIELPYADPLIIPVGIKTSTKSWGDCE